MGTTKFYQQLLRQQLVKAEQKKNQQAKELSQSRKLLLTQPLILLNYVEPPEEWLKLRGKDMPTWRKTLSELKSTVGDTEFKQLVQKYVKNTESRRAIFNYVR